MCELPANATIRGYGLSYETEVTNGLTNQELQKKIDEMTFVRKHSPKGHKKVYCMPSSVNGRTLYQ